MTIDLIAFINQSGSDLEESKEANLGEVEATNLARSKISSIAKGFFYFQSFDLKEKVQSFRIEKKKEWATEKKLVWKDEVKEEKVPAWVEKSVPYYKKISKPVWEKVWVPIEDHGHGHGWD